ncbi:hypothetical protein NBRC116591_17910 [Sessilibacter corallicola]|uniref:Uncharacterized protein n=1 Tax=Sessilibacter corallicola TaxID=2904075 RepID=A0ABQ0A8K7_9GAMM
MLNEGQKKLLSLITERDDKLNWYKTGRTYINKFNNPAELSESFKFLEGESLFITEKDRSTLAI